MFRRFFFVLLIVMLPLQSTWATAKAYCEHEQGSAAKHFGHDAHQHQATNEENTDDGGSAPPHADCGFCHHGSVGVASSLLDTPSSASTFPVVWPESSLIPTVFIEGPERPDWLLAA